MSKAQCATCHPAASEFISAGRYTDITATPPTGDLAGGIKVPGLRGISLTAPYFHDGSAATLPEVVNRFDSRGTLGLTDVDALTISMARRVASSVSLETAALAIAIGVLSNTALKLTVALFFGSPGFRRVAGGTLFGMIVAAGASLLFGR